MVEFTDVELRAITKLVLFGIEARKGEYLYQPCASLSAMESIARKLDIDPERIRPSDDR